MAEPCKLANLGPHKVPGIWRDMLPPEVLSLSFPQERLAQCGHCPQVAAHGYRPDYRCCTYFPRVPNFLMGQALADPHTASIIRQAEVQECFLPDGLAPSPRDWATFLVDVKEQKFGKSDRVLCPFLQRQSGQCGIYAYRNSVCSTYFCEHDDGRQGRRFWEGIKSLANRAEIALSQWSLQESGFDVAAYMNRLDQLADKLSDVSAAPGGWSLEARQFLWGNWFGREQDLYRHCAEATYRCRANLKVIAAGTPILSAHVFARAVSAYSGVEHDEDMVRPSSSEKLGLRVLKQHRKLRRAIPGRDPHF